MVVQYYVDLEGKIGLVMSGGFEKPQGYKGKGKEGKGQGTDYMTLDKPLTLLKGQGFFRRVRDF